ncbi:hypothetical protein TCAL_05099 [Tigriopus californicus]|uniref:C2H2-type domain-containing protein n=1 Tax=Tigriopus californicus TaxID=6832 RepID=A0A553NTE6_TIGCA|nr:uncharacterized protein LOC131880193 [Tigriopus californicus]TRY68688.1 hypothetical protein TCAL_05099 [Tigriopus californicus]|eukprot:TCALIF_05099-PA protein Name:"Similar to ZSCAN5D Putative zinc finger and SCAN domain-containing protein 5D (Homo sapiens)" AED:0.19 eAED:0.20 QI:0/-1/0/1/-1/1/1/0/696
MKAHLQTHVQALAQRAALGTTVRIESTFARQRRWAAETRLRNLDPPAPTCLSPDRQPEFGDRPTGLRSLILDHPYSYLTDRLFQVKREIEAERYNRPIVHRQLGSNDRGLNADPSMEVDVASVMAPIDHRPLNEPDPMRWPTTDCRGFVLPDVGWDVQGQGFEAGGPLPLVGRCEEHPEVSLANPTELPVWTPASALLSEPLPMSQTGSTGERLDEDVEKQLAFKAIEHLQSLGSAQTEYWCTICVPHRRYTSYSTVLGHFRSHSGFRPFECPVCHDFFTRQHSLNYHMLIHNNETRFTCDDCGKKFRHPSHFKVHKRKHTGESPYHCVSCQSRFKTRNTYKRHLKLTHHLILTKTGIQPIISKDPRHEQKVPEQPPQSCSLVSMDFIHDHDSLHGNDEEVAELSRELEKQDEILNQKRIVQIGSASSDEGSYYPSTESEFSSPDQDLVVNAADSLLNAKEDFMGLPQFDSSPPPGLAALAVKFAPNDSRQPIVPSSPLQSHGKSPNLLESDRHRSAFNRFQDEKKFKIHDEEDDDNAVIRRPVVLINPRSSTLKPLAKAILANINGQQVYLIPQETKNPSVPQQPITVASSLSSSSSSSSSMVGTSKLEQCLRYGSAAIQQTSSKQLIGSSYTMIPPRISSDGGASRARSGNRRIVSHVKLVQPSESSGANANLVIGKGGPIVVTNISNPTQVQG